MYMYDMTWHACMYLCRLHICCISLCSQFNSLNGKCEWKSLSDSCVTFGNIYSSSSTSSSSSGSSRTKWKNNGTLFISDERLSISCSSVWTHFLCFGVDLYSCIVCVWVCMWYCARISGDIKSNLSAIYTVWNLIAY